MIIYFADRQLNILGQASTELPEGLIVTDDWKTEDIETGVSVFECKIPFDSKNRLMVEAYTEVGNYVLRSHDKENEFYTIIDVEIDTKKQEVYIYAEDDGMDLLNEVVGAYEADKAYPISHYIDKYAAGAGFQIGINEVANLTRKLSWDGESTATERIASIATQFDGCEVSYSFDVDGLLVTNKYINIYKERGKDIGVTLRLTQDIDSIITTKSIANLATALQCTGGTPEDQNYEDDVEPSAITLEGYSYDDGDFYVEGGLLKSREALKKWARYLWKNDETHKSGGHIVKQFSYDTLSQSTLCAHAITELKKIREMEVNYEVDITNFPENLKIGDRGNIVDDAGELYVSARVLQLKTSVANQEYKATFGEYLIQSSGIHQKVAELAAQFAKNAKSAARAAAIATYAQTMADAASEQVNAAVTEAENAQKAAEEATEAANTATESAQAAQLAADNAQAAVDTVERNVASLETTIADAEEAAAQARQAATTAETKAAEAQQAAANAQAKVEESADALSEAQENAETALAKATTAESTANQAASDAEKAATTAAAAKLDAENAQKDIDTFSESLTTLQNTMAADYARKTDLTQATASLQTQITQNANEISSTATKVQEIDETANNAQEQAQAAQDEAALAKQQADQATADALAAQSAADNAAAAATAAQNEADTAKAAAETAQSVADQAEADLEAAKADLATVTSRVDATEADIVAAQQAVTAAQTAANNAKADADAAAKKAADAQSTADTAVSNAATAQTAANEAASNAALAQKTADEAKGDASAAQAKANEAAATAAEAQRTADTAKTNAATAQSTADAAAQAAANAQAAADDADAKAVQAAADLAEAQQNLADVTSRVDATEEEVEAAQAAVTTAQAAADKAQEEAEAAQATADTAKANAATAQTAANNAKAAADAAQADATAAQEAADKAQADVDALAVRVTTAETKITQNSEQIALMAKKTEVAETLGGYYTKEETDAAIKVKSDAITSSVSATYATKQEVEDIEVGGRNLLVYKDITTIYEQVVASDATTGVISGESFTWYLDPKLYLEPGGTYTVSNKSIINNDENYVNRVRVRPAYSTSESVDYGTMFYLDSGASYTFTLPEEMAADARFVVYITWGSTTESFTITGLKVEKGNKPTDYTPAPEDVSNGIDNAQDTADQASDSATAANERITTAESLIQQLSNCIAMLVTDENGESLMTQTENGWTFSMKETAEAVSSLISSLEALQQEAGSTQATVDVLRQAVSDHGATLEYVNVTTYEDEPCIELGESDSDFKLLITNTRIMFMNGSNVPTYINTNGLVTKNIEVTGEIVQGGYVMLNTSDGGWGLLWKGVSG